MGIVHLKERMRDVPGIESLTMTMEAGKQNYHLNGRSISFDASASDAMVEVGIRAAIASPAIVQMAAGGPVTPDVVSAAAAVLHPSVAAHVAPTPLPPVSPVQGTSPMADPAPATSPAAHALTIKDALANHAVKLDQILQAQLALLNSTLDEQLNTVTTGTGAVIGKVKAHTDDFKAILGQFSNNLG